MLRFFVNKSRRAILRYVPPQVTRHLPASFKGPKPTAGPPPGISIETLGALCAEQLGAGVRKCAYQHLSAWKKHGTFRLYVVGENGVERTFILKDEIYTTDENPALHGLCVLPGPPEYHVYERSVDTALSKFLPTLFWCAEIEPGRHFRYLVEDLRLTYRRLHFNRKDLLFAVRALVDVHKAMNLTLARKEDHNLIRYDRRYSERIIEYSRRNLEDYARATGDDKVSEIIKLWSNVLTYHKESESCRDELHQPIHGDYTLAHVYWKNGPDGVKIVDWEWAGIGVPHVDLAALLKWADPEIRREAIGIFASEHDQLSLHEHARMLGWCLLERKLLDAGFFARQKIMKQPHAQAGSGYFGRSVSDVLAIAKGARYAATVG